MFLTGPAPASLLSARRIRPILLAVAFVLAVGGPAAARPASPVPSPSITLTAAAGPAGWSQLTPTAAPLPRDSAEVAYDTGTSTVVMSGGEASCGPQGREVYQDTWTWGGKAWKEVANNAPPVFGVPAAYDGATQTFDVLWYAGCADGPTTSEWNGESWGTGVAPTTPQAVQTSFPDDDGAMAYDASTQTIVLWSPSPPVNPGGPSAPGSESTTWAWDGTTWNQLSPSVSPPPSLGDSKDVQMVYDTSTSQILLYGDHSQAMWAWNGNDWSELSGSGSGPSPRVGASMVYDSALGQVLLFGGDTPTAYTTASGGQPETYTLGAPLNDLWAWSGGAWQQQHPATSPPARFYAQMAFDASDGQVVLFGGAVNDNADIADTWVYGPTA